MVKPFILLLTSLLLASTGCSTLSTVNGAIPLAPGQSQHSLVVKVQAGGGNVVANAGVPLPGFEYQYRRGIKEDVDVGVRAYNAGLLFDVRYRFWQYKGWHWAINPSLAGLPIPSRGAVETRLPLLVEKKVSDAWSIGGGSTLILRDQWISIDSAEIGKGSDHRLDVFAGGNLRAERRNKRDSFAWAFSIDAYGQPARHGNLVVAGGVQLNWRNAKRN